MAASAEADTSCSHASQRKCQHLELPPSINRRVCSDRGRALCHACLRERGFVSRKITEGAARIKLGLDRKLLLGNLDAVRDWGHARDYMSAAWLMLQQDRPDDYVIATGRATSVAEFCRLAFDYVGLNPNDHVEIDKELLRPIDVDRLVGDAGKARRVLGWSPEIALEGIIGEMIDEDLRELSSSKSVLRVRP